MKYAILAALLIVASGAAFAQDIALNPEHGDVIAITQDKFLLRFQKHEFSSINGAVLSSCLLVYPDGRYRFEREYQDYNDRRPTARVFEGQLETGDVDRLRGIVTTPDFRSVHVNPQGNMIRTNESYSVYLLRADGGQHFMITDETRRTYSKALKPFIDWERGMEKRKTAEIKGAMANGCQFPRRIQLPPGVQMPEDDER
jgi:hypothetical protein